VHIGFLGRRMGRAMRGVSGESLMVHSHANEDVGVPGRGGALMSSLGENGKANGEAVGGESLVVHSHANEDVGVPGSWVGALMFFFG
jgi:hypothetical protein